MHKSCDYLEMVKEKLNLSSDYALAKALQTSPTAICNYRKGRSHFDVRMSVKVAEILEKNPMSVIADVEIERSKKDSDKNFWENYSSSLSRAAAVVLCGTTNPGANSQEINEPNLYYVKLELERDRANTALLSIIYLLLCLFQRPAYRAI